MVIVHVFCALQYPAATDCYSSILVHGVFCWTDAHRIWGGIRCYDLYRLHGTHSRSSREDFTADPDANVLAVHGIDCGHFLLCLTYDSCFELIGTAIPSNI